MNKIELGRLRDMRTFALKAIQFIEGKSRDNFEDDEKLQFAIFHALQIVGEAASKIPKLTQQLHPQIAWAGVIGMRHIIVHGYGEVDLEIVWLTLQKDLPTLIEQLNTVITNEQDSSLIE